MNQISFGKWCEQNNHKDFIERWDETLNNCSIYDIGITDKKMYYFKCPTGRHESELAHINKFHTGKCYQIHCSKCDSFAQKMIDKIGENEFNYIWSDKNEISPWDFGASSKQPAWFVCHNGHTYEQSMTCKYRQNQKCPYCSNRKLSRENSLGEKFPSIIKIWSEKNTTTPYDYSPHSGKSVWLKCSENKHSDYYRSIAISQECNFRCPQCGLESLKGMRLEDLTGQIFGELEVIEYDNSNALNGSYWICKCSCGVEKSIRAASLKNGSIKTCGNKSFHHSGENSTNWKGGITPINILARNNTKYNNWRNSVYAKDWYTCQCCGRSKNIIKNAHHIMSFSDNIKLRYDVENGITLCEECHYSTKKGSFHNVYGTVNYTAENLEEYINNRRKILGINIPFSLEEYRKGNILKPNDIVVDKEETLWLMKESV